MKQEKNKSSYTLVRLDESTLRYCYGFDCGNEYINHYIKRVAVNDVDSTSFAYIDNEKNRAVCVYSLCCSGIVANQYNKLYIYPAVEIKIFALDKEYQHKKANNTEDTYGDIFLAYVINSIGEFTDNYCGAGRIVLYAVPEYENFYKRNFFKNFQDFMSPDESMVNEDCVPMFYVF